MANVLEGHEWGPETLQDYRRWTRLRLLLKWPGKCPYCGAEDPSAEHILEAHARPLLPPEATEAADGVGALTLLRTDLAASALRRNIRLVGQILRGGRDWRWLHPPPGLPGEKQAAAEPRETSQAA